MPCSRKWSQTGSHADKHSLKCALYVGLDLLVAPAATQPVRPASTQACQLWKDMHLGAVYRQRRYSSIAFYPGKAYMMHTFEP